MLSLLSKCFWSQWFGFIYAGWSKVYIDSVSKGRVFFVNYLITFALVTNDYGFTQLSSDQS
jgi:hypothetical protein